MFELKNSNFIVERVKFSRQYLEKTSFSTRHPQCPTGTLNLCDDNQGLFFN